MVRARRWLLGLALLVLSASEVGAEASSDRIPAVAAEVEQVVLDQDGRRVSVATTGLLLAEQAARLELETEPGRSGYAEYQLYDFGRRRLYRVFPEERIYFEVALSALLVAKGFVEGWAPKPPNLATRLIPLKDDSVEGTPARLMLVEYPRVRGRGAEYSLVWSAVPAGRLPLRVVYWQGTGQTVVLTYRRVESRLIDRSDITVPDDFSNLSPF